MKRSVNTMSKNLTADLREYVRESLNAPTIGVAPVERFENAPKGHRPTDLLPGAKSVVAVPIPVLRSLLDLLTRMEKAQTYPSRHSVTSQAKEEVTDVNKAMYTHVYGRCCYETHNVEAHRIGLWASVWLENQGYESIYVPVSAGMTFAPMPFGDIFPSIFSMRHAAVASGLGELGLNNLFMTPDMGPRVRLTAFITTAPLEPDPMYAGSLCLGEQCSQCVKSCPAKAFGEAYDFEIAGKRMRLASFDKKKCARRSEFCQGTCVRTCPVGLRGSFKT
jgi:epoxyqueuosine reductase